MGLCEACDGSGIVTNFPFHPPKNIMEETCDKKQQVMLDSWSKYCIENMSHPCPTCKPLEYKIYKLELKSNKLERWFLKYMKNKKSGNCEACLGLTAQEIMEEEIPIVKHIIEDEVWLESERRHCPVCDNDPEVQKRIINVIKEKGEEMREEAVDNLRKKKRRKSD